LKATTIKLIDFLSTLFYHAHNAEQHMDAVSHACNWASNRSVAPELL